MDEQKEHKDSVLTDKSLWKQHVEEKFADIIPFKPMQKLPIVDDNGKVITILDFQGDYQPDIVVIDRKFYTRDPAGFYRSAIAYVTNKQIVFTKTGMEEKL